MNTRVWSRLRRGIVALGTLALLGFGGSPPTARAAGLLMADGGLGGLLEITEHDVNVTINNGVAVTRVTQVFRNLENRQVEALYTFPVPKGASVANFSMWINGKEMVGEVLEKQRAREIYNSYKQQKRDPGLLEQVDYKTFEMRIFPIAANAEQRVEITYYQELDIDHDWYTYVYPLATSTRAGIDARVKGRFALNVNANSAIPMTEVSSPSHSNQFVMARHAPGYVQASLENTAGTLARDVVLACHLERPRTGLDVITSRAGSEDGYFLMTLTAGDDVAALDAGMDYVFIVDASGSMANDEKLILSREAVAAFLKELGPEDRFEVMAFNVQAYPHFGSLRAADDAGLAAAETFLASQQARGGTVLRPALEVAFRYASSDRPLNVVILSDGMTEQQERNILVQMSHQAPAGARVFCIGVGNEVNRPLLEQLAAESGGLASFVSTGDDFKRQAKAFRRKLMSPVMADVSVSIDGLETYDQAPRQTPNLYHGSPVRVYGRYRGDGPVGITVRGTVRGMEVKQTATVTFPREDATSPEIERMWAWHRVNDLQREINRSGQTPERAGEMVRLGEGYSIVTEYTSFLVLENDAEFQRWQIERRNVRRTARDRAAQQAWEAKLEQIRSRANADLGPSALETAVAQATPANVSTRARPLASPASAASPSPARPASQSQGIDFNIGSGPVGPVFVLVAAWLARRRQANRIG